MASTVWSKKSIRTACEGQPCWLLNSSARLYQTAPVIEHSSRRIVHSATTAHPTDAWVAQQLKEATPWSQGPRFLIHDRDSKFGQRFSAIATGTGIEEILTPVRAPNANAVCERFVGSLRRECLDHMLVLNQKYLNVITATTSTTITGIDRIKD